MQKIFPQDIQTLEFEQKTKTQIVNEKCKISKVPLSPFIFTFLNIFEKNRKSILESWFWGCPPYITDEFDEFGRIAKELGFVSVASGPLVRSSYHAEKHIH